MVAAVAGPLVQFLGDVVFFPPLLVVLEATVGRQSDPALRQQYILVLSPSFGFGVPVKAAVAGLATLVGDVMIFSAAPLLGVAHFLVALVPVFAVVDETGHRQ